MLLADSSALCALIDAREPDHRACAAVLRATDEALLATWPELTESMHLLGRMTGWRGQESLWGFVTRGALIVESPSPGQVDRSRTLMEKYRDVPMDLADASLVALAEERKLKRVFTLDQGFEIYRIHGRSAFDIVP